MTDATLFHALQFMLVGWTLGNACWAFGLWLWHGRVRADQEKNLAGLKWLVKEIERRPAVEESVTTRERNDISTVA